MQQINVPGVGPVNFPDDMSDEDITRAIETEIIPGYQPSVEPAAPVEEKGGFWDAGSAGIDLLQGSLASARQGFNRIVGDDEEADSLQAYIDQQAAEREEALPGGPQMFTEAETAGDYWDAFKEGAGYSLPLSGPALIGGMIGGAKYGAGLGSFFGPAGAILGGIGGTVIGGIIAGTIPFYGLNRERQKEVLGEVQSEAKALGAAIPQAGMDALLSKIIPGIGKGWTGNILTRTLKGTGAGAATEAPTEMLQQVLERWQAGLDLDSEDAIAEYKEALIAGGALGAGFGGATGPFNTPRAEQDAGDAPPSPERSFLEQRAKERRDQYDQRQQEKEAARTQAEEGAVQAEEADAVVAKEAEAAAAQERGRITPEGYIGPEGQLPAPLPPPKWSPEPVLTEEAEAEVAAAPESLFDISYLPESQQVEVVEERAKMAADGQRKKILADPSEPVFEAADLGSYGAQVANYFAPRQPGKTTYSVQDLRDAGIHKGALDLIASQKDGAPQRYGIEADENYINFGKALAKAKGYGTSSQPWKRFVKQFTGKDSSQSLNVSDLKSLVEGIQSLPNNNAESRAAKKADREQVEAADRDALFEDSYSKAMSFLKTAQIADKAALTASPQEGGLGLPSGEAQKLLDAGVNRGDLRKMGVNRLKEQTQYAFNDKTGTPREISTPQEPQEGQTQQLRVKEIGVRKGPYDEGGDGWTFEIDGTPGPMFETKEAAEKAGKETAAARGARDPIPFRGRREFAVVQDVLDADGQRASTAPVQTFPSFEEALGYAEQQGIDIDESTIADAEARRAAALDAAPEPEPAPEKTVEQRKQEIRARIEQNRETNREARLRMEALNKVDGGLTIPRTEMGEIRSALTARLQELNIPNVKIIAQNFINDGSKIEFGGKFENGTIFLSLHAFRTGDRNEVDMNKLIGTLNHEVIHALKENGIITAKQWDALIRASKKQKTDGVTFWQREIDRQIEFKRQDDAAGIVRTPKQQAELDEGGEVFVEEVVAEMFRIWAANDGKFPGTPASIFRKMLNFIEALGNAFRGRGYMTADSVFKGIDTGAAGRQAPRTAPVTGSLEDVEYDEFTMDEYEPGRMSRTDQQMYEFKIRRVGKDSVTRRVMATSPQEARRKAIEQMKRTKEGFEVVDIKPWSSLAEEVRKDFDAKLPDEAKNGNRYSRRMVADMTNVESQAEFDAWFEGAELQDKNGNPIILYRGTRGSVTDETGRAVPSPEIRINDQGMSFFSFDPKFTEMFSQPEFEPDPVPEGEIGAPPPYIRLDGDLEVELPRTIPVIINSKKLFNPDTEAQWKQLREYADDKEAFDAAKADYDAQVREQQEYGEPKDTWYRIENAPSIMDAIRKSPFDSLFLWEDGYRNVAVFDAKQVKSVFNKFEPGAASSSRYSRTSSPLAQFIQDNPEGFTVSVDGQTVPQSGFVVAPLKQTEVILDAETVRSGNMTDLVDMVEDLQQVTGQDAYAGGWLNEEDGKYYLDAVSVIENYDEAVYTALSGDQIGLFNLDTFEVIDTGEAVNALKENGTYSPEREYDARAKNQELGRRFEKKRAERAGGGGGEGNRFSRISPRNPTAVSRTEDPAGGRLQIGASHVLDNDPKNREKIVQILKTYPGFKTTKRNPEAVVEEFKNFVKDNLLFIFDNVPPETRKRSKLWYEGARKIVDDWSAKYNLPPEQIAAVLAALSPQKDWYQNVSLAERVLDIHTQFTRGNTKAWMPPAEMLQRGEQLYLMNDKGKPKTDKMSVQRRGYIKEILSKPYMDIKHDDPAVQRDMQAIWVRTYDQTYNNRGYRTVTPEGLFVGEPAGVAAWGSNSEIGKALGVLSGGDLNAISDMMGLQHKVRSFFNNIIDPNSLDGDVTIDTHAVAAALLRALSQSSKEVAQAFGSSLDKDKQLSDWISPPGSTVTGAKGLYGIYADAYREAAAARGVLPREMQSITWEAIRGLFPKKWKQPENVKAIDNIWREYEAGGIGLGDARQKIIQTAGKIDEPTWKRDELPSTAGAEGVASSSYAGELSGGGVSGRYSRGLRSDGRGGPSGAPQGPGLVQAPNGTTSFGGFVLPGSSKVAPVQMNSGAVNHIKKVRFHNNSDAEDFSHLENFIKYSPVGNMRQVGVLLEEMLKAYQANPNAREFKVKRSPDRDSRYVLEWYSPAFKTRNKTARLVLEAKPTPVGTVMDVVTFFLDIPTYSMNGPREQKYSRVPNGGPQAINDGFADQAFADAEGIVGRFIKKVGRSATAREIRERLQDKYIEVQEWLTNYHDQLKLQGKTMTDRENFFMQENNMHGQRGNMQSHQKLNVYAPIMKRIGEMGVTMEDLGQYMFAMNAEEKNAYIESIGGRPGGSGVLDAAKYKADTLKKFQDAGTLSNIQAAATLARKIIENTNEIYLRAGLISPEQKAAGDAAMPNYVPSRGKVENDLDPDVMSIGGSAHGKGYNVRGAENMRLTGREDIPPLDEIMTNIVAQNINAINRAYKNKVARSFYELAKSNPNDPTIQIIDETNKRDYFVEVANVNGKIIKRVDPRWKDHPEMFWVKVRGQDVGIHFPGSERMVRALRHADTPTNIGPVYKFLLGFNRYLASVNTSWNPDFILSNLLKDMQQAGIVSNQVGGKGIAAKIIMDVPAAILGVREVLRGGTTNSEFAKEFADMRRAGGTTEYLGVTDMDLTSKKLKQELEEFSGGGVGKSRKVLRSVVNFIEDYNRVAENATRLAAYVNAKKMGATKDQAAYLAKNLTVNFDRGGTYKAQANALFLFYNAALQGSHVIFNSVARSKKVQGVMAGVIGAGFTSDLVNAMFFSEEDDDGILLYDKLPDHVLQSRMVFMGDKSDAAEPYFGIPMPYGFNAFFNLGRVMSKLTRGGYNNSWDAAGDAAYPMIDAFNPLGGTNSFLNFVSPTILDLGVDLESNKDFAGRDIVPESGNPFAKYEQPDSQKYWNSTAKPFVGMASFMNSLFGGSEWEKGPLDYSPEQIEYVYDYALGGAGKFALRVAQLPGTVSNIIADDWAEVRVNQIPFVRNFMGNVGNQEDVQLYIENSTDVMTQLNKLDGLKELKRPELVRQHLAEKGDEIRLAKYFTNVDKQLRKIRNMEKQVRAHEGLSDEMKKKQLRKYRDMKMSLMENANGLYKSMKDRD